MWTNSLERDFRSSNFRPDFLSFSISCLNWIYRNRSLRILKICYAPCGLIIMRSLKPPPNRRKTAVVYHWHIFLIQELRSIAARAGQDSKRVGVGITKVLGKVFSPIVRAVFENIGNKVRKSSKRDKNLIFEAKFSASQKNYGHEFSTGWTVLPRRSDGMSFSQIVRVVFEKVGKKSKNGQKFDFWG